MASKPETAEEQEAIATVDQVRRRRWRRAGDASAGAHHRGLGAQAPSAGVLFGPASWATSSPRSRLVCRRHGVARPHRCRHAPPRCSCHWPTSRHPPPAHRAHLDQKAIPTSLRLADQPRMLAANARRHTGTSGPSDTPVTRLMAVLAAQPSPSPPRSPRPLHTPASMLGPLHDTGPPATAHLKDQRLRVRTRRSTNTTQVRVRSG